MIYYSLFLLEDQPASWSSSFSSLDCLLESESITFERIFVSLWNEDIKLVEQSNVIDVPGLSYRNIPSLASTVTGEMVISFTHSPFLLPLCYFCFFSNNNDDCRLYLLRHVFVSVVAGFSNLEVESNPCFTTTRKNRIYELLIPANVVKENGLTFCDRIKYIDGEGIMGLKANGLMLGFASKDGTGFAEETGLKRVILSTFITTPFIHHSSSPLSKQLSMS
ncbi:hypothetical protein HID58_081308 [Brassica napus]|uniref:Uncharacterized protein n=1 Tax=Brassica napus TaxID=3708 RepID=A0ABQ7Y7D4_BRANA|nr:hypothetical protein HID58_081308 [Brassica napus]